MIEHKDTVQIYIHFLWNSLREELTAHHLEVHNQRNEKSDRQRDCRVRNVAIFDLSHASLLQLKNVPVFECLSDFSSYDILELYNTTNMK